MPGGAVAEFLEMADATRIRVARWAPPQTTGTPRGTVVILNGRSEFIEKYFETIESLRARGFTVATLDWRGQGRSDRALANPHKGHVDDFEAYVSDLQQFHTRWVQPHCPGPYSLLAHCMGGHIALRYLAQNPGDFERAIFSAPMRGIGSGQEFQRPFSHFDVHDVYSGREIRDLDGPPGPVSGNVYGSAIYWKKSISPMKPSRLVRMM